MKLIDLFKCQKNPKFKGLTRAEILLKADISRRAVDRKLTNLAKQGIIEKKIVKRKVYILKK